MPSTPFEQTDGNPSRETSKARERLRERSEGLDALSMKEAQPSLVITPCPW